MDLKFVLTLIQFTYTENLNEHTDWQLMWIIRSHVVYFIVHFATKDTASCILNLMERRDT